MTDPEIINVLDYIDDETIAGRIADTVRNLRAEISLLRADLGDQLSMRDADAFTIGNLNAELAARDHRIAAAEQDRDDYRTSAEKVAYVHVGLVAERDAALAQVQALRAALERIATMDGADDCGSMTWLAGRIANAAIAALDGGAVLEVLEVE